MQWLASIFERFRGIAYLLLTDASKNVDRPVLAVDWDGGFYSISDRATVFVGRVHGIVDFLQKNNVVQCEEVK